MAEMKYSELKKSLDSKNFEKLYFLCGETDLINYFEKKILSDTIGKNYTQFDYTVLNAESFSNEKLQTAINTFPMMTSKKCIVIKNIEWESINSNDLKLLLELLSDIPDFSLVVICQTSPNPASKHLAKLNKLKTFVRKNGVFCELSQKDFPMERQIIAWAKRDYDKTLIPKQAKKIMELCKGYQIHEIKNEVEKICEFEKSDEIKDESLNILWKPKQKVSIFELPKAIRAGKVDLSFEILSSLLEQNEEPLTIIAVIFSEFNDVYRVKLFSESGKSSGDIINTFDYKNKEFRIKNAQSFSKKFNSDDIEKIIFQIAKADMELKSTNFDSKVIISKLMVYIFEKMKNIN